MTGWKRYFVAIVGGLVGAFAWGFLNAALGSPPIFGVIGAILIVIGALIWAREK